ncbi:MAG: glycosyltransferase family 1 protein [Lactobacillales bacterium]|nr:glycosyltransferase family 1 protein [Lactobacillales bacterium]
MKRVLQIGMTDNWGGIESYIINYYRNIDKNKVQFDFVNIYPNDLCFQNEIEELGGKIYKVPSYYKHPIAYMKKVKKIIKENKYEIVHCNMNSAVFLFPIIAAKLAKAKVVIAHSHNSSSDKGFLKDFIHAVNKRFIPLFANTYFACSNKAGKWFYSKKVLKSKRYYVINNAIDSKKYLFNEKVRQEKRKELNIKDSTTVLGHVGRFNKQKNHEFLIEIFNEYNKKYSDSILLLVGIGPLQEKIKNQVDELKLNEKVIFLNQRKDVNELLQAMDIFMLPSLYEGLPLVGVEAQSSGIPCVLSDTITDELKLLEDKVYYVGLNSPLQEWVETIHKCTTLKRINEYENIVKSGYDIEMSTKNLIDLYEKLRSE